MATRTKRASQRDIARLAGVSQAAVSMVLNGKADEYKLAPATQDRIREVMVSLNYVPDVNGRSLRGGRNGLIGVHTYEPVFPVSSGDYYHEFLLGIEAAAVLRRQDVVLFTSTQGPDGRRTIYGAGGNRLRLADGAVILGVEQDDEELSRLAAEGYPFVFVGRRDVPGAQVPFVTADYAGGVQQIVAQIAAEGHRRVAYLGALRRLAPEKERFDAFTGACAEHQIVVAASSFLPPGAVDRSVLAALVGVDVGAVLVETVELAEAVDVVLTSPGAPLDEGIGFVVLDVPPARLAHWSHLQVPRREMGGRAVDLLLALLDGLVAPDHHDVVPCRPFHLSRRGSQPRSSTTRGRSAVL